MSFFVSCLEEELKEQRQLYQKGKRALERAPEGYLHCRERKNRPAFYQVLNIHGKMVEENISSKPQLVEALLNKKINCEVVRRAEENIRQLEKIQGKYICDSFSAVLSTLPKTYREAFVSLQKTSGSSAAQNQDYIGLPFDPESHIHETAAGIFVRSKSEELIVNALDHYGIPFHYEERFPFPDAHNRYLYPDFTFYLPSGEKKIWEHFGLMNDYDYCLRSANKLYTYQQNGFIINKNLIITQDDFRGNCSSRLINEIICRELLPYYR